jgi:hypothetical protein
MTTISKWIAEDKMNAKTAANLGPERLMWT